MLFWIVFTNFFYTMNEWPALVSLSLSLSLYCLNWKQLQGSLREQWKPLNHR